jgi:hypothetical protein
MCSHYVNYIVYRIIYGCCNVHLQNIGRTSNCSCMMVDRGELIDIRDDDVGSLIDI